MYLPHEVTRVDELDCLHRLLSVCDYFCRALADLHGGKAKSVFVGMSADNQVVHVCQRCCNPLQLNRDFDELQRDKLLALAGKPIHLCS